MKLIAGGVVAGMASGCADTYGGKTMSANEAVRLSREHDREYQAGLRADANAPGIPVRDEKRLVAALSGQKAQQDHETAEYQRFQFDQRLQLAEASAPRITVYNEPGGTSTTERNGVAFGGRERRTLMERGTAGDEGSGWYGGNSTRNAPDRFYVRSQLEDSTDKLNLDSANRQMEGAEMEALKNQSPYGAPVPGMPGYVTSPGKASSGYIDVRGYNSGTEVFDPYTGQPMRVP